MNHARKKTDMLSKKPKVTTEVNSRSFSHSTPTIPSTKCEITTGMWFRRVSVHSTKAQSRKKLES